MSDIRGSNELISGFNEMFDTISSKIPKLINSLMDTVYSVESAKKVGQAVGSLYKELVESGIPKEEALKMARDYILSMKDISGFFSNK